MLPTEQEVKKKAPLIAQEIHLAFLANKWRPEHIKSAELLVDDTHGIYVPKRFCKLYAGYSIKVKDFNSGWFNAFFEELLTAINQHTPETYTVFWHEGAILYGDESAFFDEWTTDPDTTPADPNQEPF